MQKEICLYKGIFPVLFYFGGGEGYFCTTISASFVTVSMNVSIDSVFVCFILQCM